MQQKSRKARSPFPKTVLFGRFRDLSHQGRPEKAERHHKDEGRHQIHQWDRFDLGHPEASRHQSGYHVAGAPHPGLRPFQELWLGGCLDCDGYGAYPQRHAFPHPPLPGFVDEELPMLVLR